MQFSIEETSPALDYGSDINGDFTNGQSRGDDKDEELIPPSPQQIVRSPDQSNASCSFYAEPGLATPTRQIATWSGVGDDMFMILGLDIDDGLAQSDIFLDNFVQDNNFDWEV